MYARSLLVAPSLINKTTLNYQKTPEIKWDGRCKTIDVLPHVPNTTIAATAN